jgi:Ca2+-binding EF-hand superfamily protein
VRTASFALSTLALLAVLSPARADEEAAETPDAAGLFSQLDTNKDGQLAADEIPEDRKTLFERLVRKGDKNSDGKLTAEEFAAGLAGGREKKDDEPATARRERPDAEGGPGPGRFFARLDANGDGKIVLAEIPEPGRERFEKLLERADKDKDGAITREEFLAAGPPGGTPGKPDKPDAKPQAGRDPGRLFKRMDGNADGKVVADELPEERRQMFELLIKRGDKDGDGGLSLEEFTAAVDRARPKDDDGAKKKAKTPTRPASLGGMPPGLFAALDSDGDGELSSGEIDAAAASIRKLDADGDGSVSGREVLIDVVRKRKKEK